MPHSLDKQALTQSIPHAPKSIHTHLTGCFGHAGYSDTRAALLLIFNVALTIKQMIIIINMIDVIHLALMCVTLYFIM
jgi:hypothetical protein